MTRDAVVVGAAVRAAWESSRTLTPQTTDAEPEQTRRLVQDVANTYGSEEVARASVFLVGVLASYLTRDADQPGGIDPLSDLVPGVIEKLSAIEMADPAQAPMVSGVLTAAVLGLDTLAWRDQFGPVQPAEALNHTFVIGLLSDLLDITAERPGAANEIMQEAFAPLAAEEDATT
ncbi:hypothetical protein EJC51_46205 [Streptomyces aquilus]|uniref:Uncharacterized protein n=1 Tax=Streptomyces aquilus TaxID=2548456 RepID=A0A3S9IEH6_9ACTN|nr:hypothetical protein [Streptomyces aquilus]AZP22794.1 hypothetical protein EJC51_46205 [Streptomyces aquilus]